MMQKVFGMTQTKIERAQSWVLGTPVTVTKDDGEHLDTVTRSIPWLLGGHTWVIMVEGITGAYALTRITERQNAPRGGVSTLEDE